MEKIKLLLVDDHKIVLDGISAILKQDESLEILGMAMSGKEALEKIKELEPDVTILDIRLPDASGIEVTKLVNENLLHTKVLLLTMHDTREYVVGAIKAGAFGYVLKDAGKEELITAIKTISTGKKYFSSSVSHHLAEKLQDTLDRSAETLLTKREIKVLRLVEQGKTNKEIAELLDKSVRTIESQRFNLMRKLDASNVVELIKRAHELKII